MQMSPDYAGADVVLVNTCGFLDSAKEESLEAIGEAIAENGRVIVTGCMGNEAELIRARFPDVLAVTGAHQYEAVVNAVHEAAPPVPNAFVDLVPEGGLKLTPRHYSYLKISEGCNHRCAFCIIPSCAAILSAAGSTRCCARRRSWCGGHEGTAGHQPGHLGLRRRYSPRAATWRGREVRAHMTDLARELGAHGGVWVRLHYVYPYPHVDHVIPLMAEGC
jgi:ribosomal protein S12 methylthiotransferase